MTLEFSENCVDPEVDEIGNIQYGEVDSNIRRSVAEDYVNARLDLHIHLEFPTEKYCALLNRDVEISPSGSTALKCQHTEYATKSTPCEQQVPVLIRIVQDMQIPEMPPEGVLPRTVARLKLVDDANYCGRHPSELASLFSLIVDRVVEDGELVAVVGNLTFRQDQLPNKMVEGTTEVVEHLPDDDVNPIWHGRHMVEAADLLSRLIIDIAGNDIGFEVLEGREVSLKRLDVFSGPVILDQRPFKISHDKKLRKPDSKDPKGPRDSRAHKGRVRDELRQGDEAGERIVARVGIDSPRLNLSGSLLRSLRLLLPVHRPGSSPRLPQEQTAGCPLVLGEWILAS
jgi:hypothetical protein